MPKLEGAYYKVHPKAKVKVNEVLVGDIFIYVPSNEELIINKTEFCWAGLDEKTIHHMQYMTSQKTAGTAWTEDLLDPTKFQYVGHQE